MGNQFIWLVVVFYFYLSNFNKRLQGEHGLLEITANAFAILYFNKHKKFEEIEELFKKQRGKLFWDESYGFYINYLESCEKSS